AEARESRTRVSVHLRHGRLRRRAEAAPMTPRRIKVLFAIGTLDLGGAERQLVELASRLDPAGFEPIVCVLGESGPTEDGPLAAILRDRGVRINYLGFRGFRTRSRLHVASATRAMLRLWSIMRRERPVIFHGVLFWAYVTGTLIAAAAGVPVV